MASNESPLWSSVLQKESLDLMVTAWPALSECGRAKLIERIVAGPSIATKAAGEQEDREHQQRWIDRRIFERLALLERLNEPPLPRPGEEKLAALRKLYPQWQIEPDDRAHFSSWMESSIGPETDRSPDDLNALDGAALLAELRTTGTERDGRLSAWSQVVGHRPARGVGLLRCLSTDPASGDDAIWRATLLGLRDAMVRSVVARRVVDLLILAPTEIISSRPLLSTMCDALEAISKHQPLPIPEGKFLLLWDRLVDICLCGDLETLSDRNDWVFRAINSSVGRLATVLLDFMFRQGLKAGAGLDSAFRVRFDRFTTDQTVVSRPARVILASRLLYLFAVDPDWTRDRLIPGLDWQRSEDEAAALWQGYGWSARINVELWGEVSHFLYEAFTPERRARLADTSKTLAELLMVAGVEFPAEAVPTDRSRRAISAMSVEDRRAAASWLYSFVAGPRTHDRNAPPGAEREGRADRLWEERVLPWLRRVWPRDADLRSQGTSEQFALLAIATDKCFPSAIEFLLPYMVGSDHWSYIIHNVIESQSPEAHPKAVLSLIGKIVLLDGLLFNNDLRTLLDRLTAADPELRNDPVY